MLWNTRYNWEKDTIVAHGTMRTLNEKWKAHSDGFQEYICRCGRPAIYNERREIYKCKYCDDNAEICRVPNTWSSKLFVQELDAMNIGVKRLLEPYTYEQMED